MTMRHLTLFSHFDLRLWLAASSGHARWTVLPSLQQYRPQPGDCLCGCFSISQWEALTRLGVRCLTPRVSGHAVPDEATALHCLDRLVLGESVQAGGGTGGFQSGQRALLALDAGRRWVA